MQREPPYAEQFKRWISAPITFNADYQSLTFRTRDLDAKVLTGNPVNLRLLTAQCEKELAEVQSRTRLADRVREMLALNVAENPAIADVAKKLSMSERTLRRRLQEEGVNFRDLLKDVRHDLAVHYLRDTDARIEQIAERLGYRDTACFRQAFKQVEQLSPRQWRQAQGGVESNLLLDVLEVIVELPVEGSSCPYEQERLVPLPGVGSPLKIPLRRRMARAAVAITHRASGAADGQRELLFMQRAQRAGDPWSGDMSFPGGRMHADDPTPRFAAERETWEETGLDLARH
ncbi:Uncharacterized HTH-type transcriptional regulator Rv1395, partial [Durusdinium trenchii]